MSLAPTALVTGASRGIGAAIARQLASRGCRVAVHFHRDEKAADSVISQLANPSLAHVRLRADLAKPDHVEQLWTSAAERLGPIDILVNNAGIYGDHPPLATSYGDWQQAWQRTLATNLLGPANLCHLAAQTMAARRSGRMVNISSRGAFRGEPHSPAYGASKAGLNSLSQSLAKALAPHGVYVFCLAPGWVETDMAAGYLAGAAAPEILAQHPLGRVATADEIATTAVFCALDAPAAMTGAIIDVNGASYLRT